MGLEPRISEEYKAKFIDTHAYPPSTHWMLQGVAAVIEDELETWRPTLTELIRIIPHDDFGEKLIKAGHAYGVGKQLISGFPAPAILMFCSALNIVGEAPNVALKESIGIAENEIREAGLSESESIKQVLNAAHQRAAFDMVSEMLREEFRIGLRRTGRYDESQIDEDILRIVNIGHQARHDALINITEWSTIPVSDFMVVDINAIPKGQEFWQNLLQEMAKGYTFVGTGRLGTLAAKAKVGCAQSLLARVESIRNNPVE